MANVLNLKTGPCDVLVDDVSIGHTEGDAVFARNAQFRERKVNMYGEAIVDIIHTGDQPTVKIQIAEVTLANVQIVWPEATVVGNTMHFGRKPGLKMSTYAKKITLRPLQASDGTEDIVLRKCVVREFAEIGFNWANDRVYEVTLQALIDESQADGAYLGYMKVPTGS